MFKYLKLYYSYVYINFMVACKLSANIILILAISMCKLRRYYFFLSIRMINSLYYYKPKIIKIIHF